MTLEPPSPRGGRWRRREPPVSRAYSGGAGRAASVLAAAIALVVASTMPPQPAAAQSGSEASVRLTITELTGVLGPGSRPPPDDETAEVERPPMDLELRVLVENDGEAPVSDLTLVIEVHAPAESRAQLRRALQGDLGGSATSVRSVDVLDGGRLPPGEMAGIAETIDRDEISQSERGGAVRPVRIAVVRGLQVLDEVVTPVVWLSEVPRVPLTATLVWPYDSPPLRTVGGAYLGGADRELRPGGRLDVLLRTIERAVDPLVTFAPAPHLLEDLADRADGFTAFERQEDGALESRAVTASGPEARLADQTLQRVREVAGELPLSPLAGTYAGADIAALHAVGGAVAELAADAAVDGRRRLQRQLGRDIQAATHLLYGSIDHAMLDLVPGESVLVAYDATTEPPLVDEQEVRSAVRSLRAPSGRVVRAVVSDPYLDEALRAMDQAAGPVIAAQRVLGESAMAYLSGQRANERALLLLPPPNWAPSPNAAARLLDGLAEATWLTLAAPEQLVRGVDTSGLDFASAPFGPFPAAFATALEQATVNLEAAAAALPDGETRLGGRSIPELTDTLLRATSRWLRGTNEAEAEALVRDVQRAADETFGDVQISTGPITLTSDSGQIPVTLQRSRGEAITVTVEVASPGRLSWPEGRRTDPLVLEPGTSQTVSFPTQALSTGTFPVTVRVTDPSGTRELGRSSMTVRSTAISGTALSLIGLVILFLLLLGALRRPDRRPRLEAVP